MTAVMMHVSEAPHLFRAVDWYTLLHCPKRDSSHQGQRRLDGLKLCAWSVPRPRACIVGVSMPTPGTRDDRQPKGWRAGRHPRPHCSPRRVLPPYPGEFTEAFQMLGRLHALSTDRVGHITHIQIPTRIYCHPVRSDELRWPFAFLRLADTGL